VTYNSKEKEVLKESLRTGKPYKNPKTSFQWIDLTEIIEAPSIVAALERSKIFANIQEWQLVSVEELE